MTRHLIVRRSATTTLLAALAMATVAARPVEAQTTALNLVLSTNQSIFGTGTTLDATLGVEYGGAPVAVDLVFGVLAPDGETLVTFQGQGLSPVFGRLSQPASMRAVLSSVTLSAGLGVVVPEFFRYTWQGNEPLGTYQMFFAATRPGAFADGRIDGGDVLAVQITPFSVQPPAAVTTDPSRATTTLVPITGGTVVATAANGTTFTLRVPAGALAAPTAITLTPVTTMTGVPGAMQRILAVRAEPAGLTFGVPATLAIHSATPGPAAVIGFSTSSAGSGIGLSPAVSLTGGDILLASVSHFSILGSGVPADLSTLINGTSSPTFVARYFALGNDRVAINALLAERFNVILPILRASLASIETLAQAIDLYAEWDVLRVIQGIGGQPIPHPDLALQGQNLLADGLRSALARLNVSCGATQDVTVAEDLLRLQSLGVELFRFLTYAHVPAVAPQPLPTVANVQGLDLASVVAGLCVRVRIVDATFPSNPQVGVAAPLAVTAGLVFGANPPVFAPALQMIADAVHASPSQRTGVTNAAGAFATTFTPNSTAVTLNVLATLLDPSLPFLSLAALTDTRSFAPVTGVTVTPAQTTVAPGATRQFTAAVSGNANQAVTWTVSGGGTISASGLFTSSGAPGTFVVTATSVADANSVGIAQVTVGAVPPPSVVDVFIQTSVGGANIIATLNPVAPGPDISVTRPIADTSGFLAALQAALAPFTVIDDLELRLDLPVNLTMDFRGFTVVDLLATIGCGGGAPPRVLTLTIGDSNGINAQACNGSTLNVTGGQTANVGVAPSGGSFTNLTLGAVDALFIVECVSSRVAVNAPTMTRLGIQRGNGCTATVTGQVTGRIALEDNLNSTLGTVTAADLNELFVDRNNGSSFTVNAGNIINFPTNSALVIISGNVGVPLSAINVGNLAGPLSIRNNTGFTDAQAQAFASARTVGGAISIFGNHP
jgi:Bacterial Ig-like domain (group 2)